MTNLEKIGALPVSNKEFEMEIVGCLGEAATGNIKPRYLDDGEALILFELLEGAYEETELTVVCKCIDGRKCARATKGPNAAGGTLSVVAALDLFNHEQAASFDDIFKSAIENLGKRGIPFGGHGAVGGDEDRTGCGASDRLAEIYAKLVDEEVEIAKLAQSLGVNVSSHEQIVSAAGRRIQASNFGSSGNRKEMIFSAKKDAIEELVGQHKELLIVINTRTGTTLNREKLGGLQVFNVDVWAFEDSVRAILDDDVAEEDIKKAVLAMVEFNLATALTLCGANMSVVVR